MGETFLSPLGEAALLVDFGRGMSMEANEAAIAFRAAVEEAGWPGIVETASTLKSVLIRFAPEVTRLETLLENAQALLATRDWRSAPLPAGRKLFRVGASFAEPDSPALGEVAEMTGLGETAVIEAVCAKPLRVLTLGFAPGMPYLGALPSSLNIPRLTELAPRVPAGAICTAVSQIVLFTVASQTGWRQVARSAFVGYRPDKPQPFVLTPGDELRFEPVRADLLDTLDGGLLAAPEVIR